MGKKGNFSMKKRLLSVVLAVVMIICALPVGTFAAGGGLTASGGIKRIAYSGTPKTDYYIGDAVDLSGLTFRGQKQNESGTQGTVLAVGDLTVSPSVIEENTTQITISYSDVPSITIAINNKGYAAVDSITVKTKPTKQSYFVGDTATDSDLAGIVVTVKYVNNYSRDVGVSDGVTVGSYDLSSAGTGSVTVAFGGKTASYDVTCAYDEIASIAVKTNPDKTSYFIGDDAKDIDLTGIEVAVTHKNEFNNHIVGVSDGVTVNSFDFDTVGNGKGEITVAYEGFTASFNVDVAYDDVDSITIKNLASKTEYFVGDTKNDVVLTGIEVIVLYKNGYSREIGADDLTVDSVDFDYEGIGSVTVAFGGKTDDFDVNCVYDEIDSIAVTKDPDKTEYFVGDDETAIDLTGIEVTITYKNDYTREIGADDLTVDDYDFTTVDEGTITVSFDAAETTFDVTCKYDEIDNIAVTRDPDKTEYFVGDDELDVELDGIVVEVTYKNGYTRYVGADDLTVDSVEGFDAVGTGTVTISFESVQTTFDATCDYDEISKIEVTSAPSKDSYFACDDETDIDIDDIEVTVTYKNGYTRVVGVADGVTVDSFDFTTAGEGKGVITVAFEDKTASFNVDCIACYYEYYLVTAPTVTEDGVYNQRAYYFDQDGNKEYVEGKDSLIDEQYTDITFASWYLRTMIQYKQEGDDYSIRFISMLNGENIDTETNKLLDYKKAGFKIKVGEMDEVEIYALEANTSFLADTEEINIADYSRPIDYFFLADTLFVEGTFDYDVSVKPFVVLTDEFNTVLTGKEITFKVNDLF